MKVGVSGHQARLGIDWTWVADVVGTELARLPVVTQALTSLAVGSDQVFAQCALAQGIPILVVIPIHNHEKYFDGDGLARYRTLLMAGERLDLEAGDDAEPAFFAAGRYIIDQCDLLIAIWDGKPAVGLGGTGDAVAYAVQRGKTCVVIDPIEQTVRRLEPGEAHRHG